MNQADHAMKLIDNRRQVILRSNGCGGYVAASLKLRPCPCGDPRCMPAVKIEAEVEGATPSEALANLTEAVLARAIRVHKKRRKKR